MTFTLGKYVPYQSPIHKLDPRIKLLGVILLMVCVFLSFNGLNAEGASVTNFSMTFTMDGLMLIICLILLAMTRTSPLDVLKSLKSLWIMIVFLLLIYSIMPSSNAVLPLAFKIGSWEVYWDSFAQAGKILLRLIMMIMLTMVLTSSTKPLDLTYAIEWYLTPLKLIHFPAHEIAMTISIALRFIPTLLEDSERIMKAQESRGASFSSGGVFKKIGALISLIIPLFVSAFNRSEELADAMECRGYDPRGKRTRYRKLSFSWIDAVAFVLVGCLFAFFIYTSVTGLNFYSLMGIANL
ncbi:MAG: energy-coupling factor transporter transmembrane component T [Bacillota bacterium]|nr:energy-coupling factor transporter transmembrane component T [Bacillota bacterium]